MPVIRAPRWKYMIGTGLSCFPIFLINQAPKRNSTLNQEMWTKSVFCREFLGVLSVCATLHETLTSESPVFYDKHVPHCRSRTDASQEQAGRLHFCDDPRHSRRAPG
jgi:hypothetical protein